MRKQHGYIYKSAGAWHVRFRETRKTPEGIRSVNCSHRLCDGKTKRAEVQRILQEYMARVNVPANTELTGITLVDFIEREYLPSVMRNLAASTVEGYRAIYTTHGYHIDARTKLRDFTTFDAYQLMLRIAARADLTTTSLKHIKSFFSGVFRHAIELGLIVGANPMQSSSVPKGKESRETYAYTPDEIERMLAILPEPANSVVLLAACTGLRKSEIRGLRWSDWSGDTLMVSRAVIGRALKETKSRSSRAPVPVCQDLKRRLIEMRESIQEIPDVQQASVSIVSRPIFEGSTGSPLDLANLASRVVTPILNASGMKWHGWHAFRRGLATFLHRRGIQDVVIQKILRHSNVSVTQACYIKTTGLDMENALTNLDGLYKIAGRA